MANAIWMCCVVQVRTLAANAGLIDVDTVFKSTTPFKAFYDVPLSEDAQNGSFKPGKADLRVGEDMWAVRGKVKVCAGRMMSACLRDSAMQKVPRGVFSHEPTTPFRSFHLLLCGQE